jgi:hypothetical protein
MYYFMLHVHHWNLPGENDIGLPNHVNLRQAWPIDPVQLAMADPASRQPPSTLLSNFDKKCWNTKAMVMLAAGDHSLPTRIQSAQLFEEKQIYFCRVSPSLGLWVESKGACLTGGPVTDTVGGPGTKHTLINGLNDKRGWDVSQEYPVLGAEHDFRNDPPGVSATDLAEVLREAHTFMQKQARNDLRDDRPINLKLAEAAGKASHRYFRGRTHTNSNSLAEKLALIVDEEALEED